MTTHPERLVLGGERKELTVMFTDLAGFTSMAEGIAPEQVTRILNEHLTRMTAIILRHGGTIDKFIGDAVMAFWGAPLGDRDHALHAVQAAIEMQAEMERWRREPSGPPELYMRVGINTGPMVVGNLGSKDRFDYTVIGDAVNLASRLESANRIYGSEILLTQAVALHVGTAIALRHVDRIRVKGKRDAIAAYRAADWDRAEALWRALVARAPGDGIAALYVGRVTACRRDGVPPGWDGTLDLDQK
jgi:adenylate cyclase